MDERLGGESSDDSTDLHAFTLIRRALHATIREGAASGTRAAAVCCRRGRSAGGRARSADALARQWGQARQGRAERQMPSSGN